MNKNLIKMYQLEINRLVFLQNKYKVDHREQISKLRDSRDRLISNLKKLCIK